MVTIDKEKAEAQAQATVKRAHTSFYWAMRLLPVEKRNAMYALYAFCRVVDDIADDPGEAADKFIRLEKWREEIANIFKGAPSGPVGQALTTAIDRYDLQQNDFLAVIDGMEMDVGDGEGEAKSRVRIADMTELNLYCDRVACAVGRLSNRVFGLEGEVSDRLAHSLGRALQLTNILRDIAEDAGQDRLYLPLELLKRHGIDDTELEGILKSEALPQVCGEIATQAREDFAEAEALLNGLPRHQVRPVLIMKAIYQPVLERLIQRGWRNLDVSVRLSRLRKLWIILKVGVLGL